MGHVDYHSEVGNSLPSRSPAAFRITWTRRRPLARICALLRRGRSTMHSASSVPLAFSLCPTKGRRVGGIGAQPRFDVPSDDTRHETPGAITKLPYPTGTSWKVLINARRTCCENSESRDTDATRANVEQWRASTAANRWRERDRDDRPTDRKAGFAVGGKP